MELKVHSQTCINELDSLISEGYAVLETIEESFNEEYKKSEEKIAKPKSGGMGATLQHFAESLPWHHLVDDDQIKVYGMVIDKWLKRVAEKLQQLFNENSVMHSFKMIEYAIENQDFTEGQYFTDESNLRVLRAKVLERIKFLLELQKKIQIPVRNSITFDSKECKVFFERQECQFQKGKFTGRLLDFMFSRSTGEPLNYDILYQALESESDKTEDAFGYSDEFAKKIEQTYKDVNRRSKEKLKIQLLIKDGDTLRLNSRPTSDPHRK